MIGETVLYIPKRTDAWLPLNGQAELAAIVTTIFDGSGESPALGLSVFTPSGVRFVGNVFECPDGKKPGTWRTKPQGGSK